MTSTSAYAPYIQTYGQNVPYLTVEEYQRAPTAMDVSNLISGGPQTQQVVLAEMIGRASSWVDQYVTNSAFGTLCATVNVENARVYGNRQGQIIVHPKLWPILEVQSFNYSVPGAGFSQTAITPAGNIWIEPQQFIVQPNASYGWNTQQGSGSLGGAWPVGISTQEYLCEWSYVNGFPNTTLAASVSAGAASVTVASGLGIYPGTQLRIYDAPDDEAVVVAANYTPGSTILPLENPLQYSHSSNTAITNLPAAVKQAAIMFVTALVKQRGSGALIVMDMGVPQNMAPGAPQHGASDVDLGKELLRPLRQMFVGY